MQVFKLGGASVKDAPSVINACTIIRNFAKEPTVVVVSAMAKTTNALEELLDTWYGRKENAQELFNQIKKFHFDIVQELVKDSSHPIYHDLDNAFLELLWMIEEEPAFSYNHHYDQVVSMGEIFSSKILSAALNENKTANYWLDVREILQTDNTYREAKVNYELSQKLVNEKLPSILNTFSLIVTQGFIGGTSENYTTTLGREGSDYTASLLAYFLNANKVVIWKDVPGMLNADPRYFKNARKMEEISYHEAIELTYYGASVIHPKTIKPLQNKNIPLYVKSFLQPNDEGTVIKESNNRLPLPAYILKPEQVLISIQPKDFSFIAEDNLSVIFSCLSKHGIKVNLMQNSAISFSICVDNDARKIENWMEELKNSFKILYNGGVQLLTVRNYDLEALHKITGDKKILLEQRSRNTIQIVLTQIMQ